MVHLIKLSVGSKSISSLLEFQARILKKRLAKGEAAELYHRTRMMPRRKNELLNGGSIYWVINSAICIRNKLLDLRPVIYEGRQHCQIVFSPEAICTKIVPFRPFQGWRYLAAQRTPEDICGANDTTDGAYSLKESLRELCLID